MRVRSRLIVALAPALLAVGVGGASPAEAAPAAVTVEVAHHVEGTVLLADGRQAGIVVDEYPSGGPAGGRWTEIELSVACESMRDCSTGGESMVDLDGYALTGTPGLGRSTLPVQQRTLYGWTDRGATQVATPIAYGATFAPTGPVTVTTTRGVDCAAASSTPCRSLVVTTTRAVTAVLTINGVTSTGSGTVTSTRALSVTAPR